MKKKTIVPLLLSVLLCIFALSVLPGCQESEKKVEGEKIPKGPFFYPHPPDMPKIQFLKSFSGPEVAKKEVSAFEHFIVGEVQEETTELKKPYGFALYDNKFYICDTGSGGIMILDLITGQFNGMKRDRRMVRPTNICIDNGIKYISDPGAKAVFVYGRDDKLLAIWGREEGISPVEAIVKGQYLYVLDLTSSQVVVLDKKTGKEIKRLGKRTEGGGEPQTGELQYVTGLAVDEQGNVYISDKINAYVTKLDSEGVYQMTFGYRHLSIHGFSRPKGLDIDKEGRLWIVDASTNVAKIFNKEGQLLLYFSQMGAWPGDMYLPVSIRIDYDHVESFRKYAAPDAQIEFLVIVTNQYGPHKISVYGFGKFPAEEARILKMRETVIEEDEDLSKGVIDAGNAEQPEDTSDQSSQ